MVTTQETNLRVNPSTGLVLTDDNLSINANVVGIAYLNPFPGAATTTLYDYALANDSLYTQNPPNTGILNLVGSSTIAVQNPMDEIGLDIATDGTAYLGARVGGAHNLYTVNLATGAATPVGAIDGGTTPIRDITVAENVIRLQPASGSGSEGAAAMLAVVREEPHGAATVDYATADGSAVAGADYTATAGTLSFAPGEVAKTIAIPMAADALEEPAETLTLALSNARGDAATQSNALLAGPVGATVTIPANSAPVVLLPGACANAATGTAGADTLAGTVAGDRLRGLGGADRIAGAAGADCLFGGRGGDRLDGGGDDDRLRGGPGADVLRGGAGDDDLRGGGGADRLSGGAGDDVIRGQGGVNAIKAGRGNDRVRARNHKRERIRCGPGRDRATVDRSDRVRGCERTRRGH